MHTVSYMHNVYIQKPNSLLVPNYLLSPCPILYDCMLSNGCLIELAPIMYIHLLHSQSSLTWSSWLLIVLHRYSLIVRFLWASSTYSISFVSSGPFCQISWMTPQVGPITSPSIYAHDHFNWNAGRGANSDAYPPERIDSLPFGSAPNL